MTMLSFLTTAFLISALTPAGGFTPSTDDFKCWTREGGDSDMLDVIVLLDHEVLEGDRTDARTEITSLGNQIAYVQIVCWPWIELNYGVKVRVGGSYVLTKGWIEQTRKDRIAALEALVSAQDRYREQTGEYAVRVEDLPDFGDLSDYGLPDHLQLDLTSTSSGWEARLEPEKGWTTGYRAPSPFYRCFAFAGEVPEGWESMRRDGQPGPTERKPECYESGTLVRTVRVG